MSLYSQEIINNSQTIDSSLSQIISQKSDFQTMMRSSAQKSQNSILAKRKHYSEDEGCRDYCQSEKNDSNVAFNDPILDDYLDAIRTVFGANNTQSILLKATNYYAKTNQQSTSNGSNAQILKVMYKMIEARLNQEIKRRISAYQACISACQQLPSDSQSSQALLNYVFENESQEYESQVAQLRRISEEFGSEQLKQLINQIMSKIKVKEISSVVFDEESSNSDDISTFNYDMEGSLSGTKNDSADSYPGLIGIFKTVMLSKIMTQLSSFQKKIKSIKQFTLMYF